MPFGILHISLINARSDHPTWDTPPSAADVVGARTQRLLTGAPRPMRTRKSERDLTPRQRRREIIDTLAMAAARMPAAHAIRRCDCVQPCEDGDDNDLQTAVSKSHDFTYSARPRAGAGDRPAEKLSESGQTPGIRLDVSATMPLSVSTTASGSRDR